MNLYKKFHLSSLTHSHMYITMKLWQISCKISPLSLHFLKIFMWEFIEFTNWTKFNLIFTKSSSYFSSKSFLMHFFWKWRNFPAINFLNLIFFFSLRRILWEKLLCQVLILPTHEFSELILFLFCFLRFCHIHNTFPNMKRRKNLTNTLNKFIFNPFPLSRRFF